MPKNIKLFRVNLKGMNLRIGSSVAYGCPYVVAESPNEALKKVQAYIAKKDLGFTYEREMNTIELLAETGDYPTCGYQLFL